MLSEKRLLEKRLCCKHFLDSDFLTYGTSRKVLKPDCIPQKLSAEPQSLIINSFEPQSLIINSFEPQSLAINSPEPQSLAINSSEPQSPIINSLTFQENDVNDENSRDFLFNRDNQVHTYSTEIPAATILNNNKARQARLKKQKNKKKIDKRDRNLKIENALLRKAVKSLKQKLRRKKSSKCQLTKSEIIEGAAKYLNDNNLQFLKMQLNHDKQRKWEEDEKQFALGLYYKSPTAYRYLKDNKQFSLPSITKIREWVNVLNLKSGKNEELLEQLKIKLESKSDFQKETVLMWDEMSIKQGLEYNLKEDFIEGYHDLSNNFGGRDNRLAKSVLVFMLNGLSFDWKQPFMYFPTCGPVPGSKLKSIILSVVECATNAGFKVRHMVCDQGAPNQKAVALLGITSKQPFIEFNENKITFGFDVPHIIKCLRNNLMNVDYIIGNDAVSWNVITELYESERNKICKAAPKLEYKHIKPNNFEKMSVKRATQIFSNSVSAALLTGFSTGELTNPATLPTAHFLKEINDVFDCLNARSPNDSNPFRRGLSNKNPLVKECLEDAVESIKTWKVKDGKNPDCFDNFILTIKGILFLWDILDSENKPYLLTSKLNQDKLENFFGFMRSRSGHNVHPTTKQFRHNFQYAIMITLLVTPAGTNCEADETRLLITDFRNCILDENEKRDTENLIHERVESWFLNNEVIHREREFDDDADDDHVVNNDSKDSTLFQICTKKYVAGYLAFKCIHKFGCSKCEETLINKLQVLNSREDYLLLWKAYPSASGATFGSLKVPSKSFFSTVLTAFQIFESEFPEQSHCKDIGKYLSKLISTAVTDVYSNNLCSEHHDFIIRLFVRTLLFSQVKWISKDTRSNSSSNKRLSSNSDSFKPNKKML